MERKSSVWNRRWLRGIGMWWAGVVVSVIGAKGKVGPRGKRWNMLGGLLSGKERASHILAGVGVGVKLGVGGDEVGNSQECYVGFIETGRVKELWDGFEGVGKVSIGWFMAFGGGAVRRGC